MQSTPHASRAAPLCKDCAHAQTVGTPRTLYCGHPNAPIDPVDGTPCLLAGMMRLSPGARFLPRAMAPCGPEGALFAQRLGDLPQGGHQPLAA